ncbi:MAG: pyruvate ferredoxin oxidoreductase [Dehalococcoidia bacterium SM23_28_1]|nr:MAG: pyruvate ferredoxin oxidoreductase [Dehalococcoidia bacterium SM23_28_1]
MSVLIGGDAGQGVESSGAGLCQAFARGGLQVFAMQDYRSRIRGGHNFYQIRLSERATYSHSSPVHLVLALTAETVPLHMDNIVEGGAVIYPERVKVDEEALKERGVQCFAMPLVAIAEEHGSRIMTNTAALAAAASVCGWPLSYLESVIRDNFQVKGAQVVESNLAVAKAAYDQAQERYAAAFSYKLKPLEAPPRMLINGNQAISLGALAGGCRFMSAYPMTPATSIIEWLSALPRELGVVTKHAEDEIAAVCMAIGASYAGARAMTATSGGGFSLMAEALGLAGMTEVPLVVVEAQRGGPSTGLPTRTEQGDLLFVINASQGEFPRVVLAPGTVEECFEAGWRAFNLAERYQCPVIILSDQFLASSLRSLDKGAIDFSTVSIDRGQLLSAEDVERLEDGYRRFAFSDSGISPRAAPGHPKAVQAISSDEHDEYGHITEEITNRQRMMDKRMRKLAAAAEEMRPPKRYGPQEADLTLVCWGSSYGPCREAVDLLKASGGSANLLHFSDLWPFPEDEAARMLKACRHTVAVEQNYTSQMARLIRMCTGLSVDRTVNKYDGRPFSPEDIVAELR